MVSTSHAQRRGLRRIFFFLERGGVAEEVKTKLMSSCGRGLDEATSKPEICEKGLEKEKSDQPNEMTGEKKNTGGAAEEMQRVDRRR